MSVLTRARKYYDEQQAITFAGLRAVRRQVREKPRDLQGLVRTITGYQLISATNASRTMAREAARDPYVNPLGFGGRTSTGVPLVVPARTLLADLAAQMATEADQLVDEMLHRIERMAVSEITNAGRDAAGTEIVAEPLWTNYVRVLRPPSCARCAILAGRIYRDNEGFPRHPECDCEHWPVTSWEEAHDEGLLFSAQDAYDKGQIGSHRTLPDGSRRFETGLSASDAQAIRDGADISQVVNATRGMYTTSIFSRDGIKVTSAGTTKRSAWRKLNPNRPVRLRPESIYDLADSREDEIRLLKLYGYIRPDADVPTDSGSAGGSGGGPPSPGPPPAPEPDDEDWSARQSALGIETHGETLEPHEIRFVERFQTAGHSLEWIPRDTVSLLPTNDFVWLNNDSLSIELKSVRPKYRSIRNQIQSATAKAAAQGVAKENFIVDIGEAILTNVLRQQLAQYNARRDRDHIRRLWVMTRGDLVEIPLA